MSGTVWQRFVLVADGEKNSVKMMLQTSGEKWIMTLGWTAATHIQYRIILEMTVLPFQSNF